MQHCLVSVYTACMQGMDLMLFIFIICFEDNLKGTQILLMLCLTGQQECDVSPEIIPDVYMIFSN